ncbi:S49 family peptidase [Listeria rocourtiae]|uniref:SDH family Clp fold serine proteinase n=1 Tax=Listeria rocourtiae TaxID=647910 RepID=UPI003D2F56A2
MTGRNVVVYYSGFLQQQNAGSNLVSINDADMSGFMSVFYGLDYSKGLDIVLHTPGGDIGATEAIVNYIKSLFGNDFRIIVPHTAFSAGTMIACASKEILMAKHSNLGPIDPQLGALACQAIVNEVEKAKADINASVNNRFLWEPILSKYSPTLIDTCEKAIELSDEMVTKWLGENMFCEDSDSLNRAKEVVKFLGSRNEQKMHSRHINKDKAREYGLKIVDIEDNQNLQDAILSLHHIVRIILEQTEIVKIIQNQNGGDYILVNNESTN